jgi:hypothetical protein
VGFLNSSSHFVSADRIVRDAIIQTPTRKTDAWGTLAS